MERSGLLKRLEALLNSELSSEPFDLRMGPDGPELVFQSPSNEVGEFTVSAGDNELIVGLGRFTHIHLSAVCRNSDVAKNTFQFLRDIFEERVEFYCGRFGGGLRKVGSKPRGWLSKWLLGSYTYRWSGRVEEQV